MGKKVVLSTVILLCLFLFSTNEANAKRRLPRATSNTRNNPISSTNSQTSTRGISSSVKFRADRNAVIVVFNNFDNIKSVSYTLNYETSGTTQGVNGTLTQANENPATRELLFGTCSAGICRYDSGISNAKLTITTTLLNGTRVIKPYKLKV